MTHKTIDVLVVDDHPAVRTGLQALINAHEDMRAVGEAWDEFTLPPAIHRCDPDVVLLDYQLPGANGIELCRRTKANVMAPLVIIYSAFVGPAMAVRACIAGADALVDKGVQPSVLATTIQRVADGERVLPEVTSETMTLAGEMLDPDDLPILGMLVNGIPTSDVAETLHLDQPALDERLDRMLVALA